jgi:hypothetical protein
MENRLKEHLFKNVITKTESDNGLKCEEKSQSPTALSSAGKEKCTVGTMERRID